MTKVKLTVLKRLDPDEIFDEFPVEKQPWMVPCELFEDNQEIILDQLVMPQGFCNTAWVSIYPNVRTIFNGGNLPFMKEKGTAIAACFDGLRPVIFKVERIED